MHPKDTDVIANSVDPDLIWVCTVCPDLPVQKLRIIRVHSEERSIFVDVLAPHALIWGHLTRTTPTTNQSYRNDSKFSDRQILINSLDPDQTARGSSLIRVYTVCLSVCIFWTRLSMVKPHCSNLRIMYIKAIFWVSKFLH